MRAQPAKHVFEKRQIFRDPEESEVVNTVESIEGVQRSDTAFAIELDRFRTDERIGISRDIPSLETAAQSPELVTENHDSLAFDPRVFDVLDEELVSAVPRL
jgi:hypothetical protein